MVWKTALDELLATQDLATQGEIVGALKARGFAVTQATVSRHLASIGAEKLDGFYRPAPPAEIGAPIYNVAVGGGGCLVVVRTAPAHASVVAHVIDRELTHDPGCDGVLGSVAGDDTVFVALARPESIGDVYRLLGWRATRGHGGNE